jgi:hypothetical protein
VFIVRGAETEAGVPNVRAPLHQEQVPNENLAVWERAALRVAIGSPAADDGKAIVGHIDAVRAIVLDDPARIADDVIVL